MTRARMGANHSVTPHTKIALQALPMRHLYVLRYSAQLPAAAAATPSATAPPPPAVA
eukprot:CAMPEP_0119324830 /NCGR_PEP_ID=MMETSP1333-20130426/64300_1 /TAXON_ID=418940 /ORGANISM="Scyphosphaera apsteinii, Strain RCC1455" /LENGTH=56 /DNA_ID=CAMNT_0007332633 /DNA_START=513 /DNA_END=681 /DNA_ORIENTATION=+